MQSCIIILFLAKFVYGEESIPYYEYDAEKNGWHAVPSWHPNMVLQQPLYYNVPEKYQEFYNSTLIRKPSGICQKEVPYVCVGYIGLKQRFNDIKTIMNLYFLALRLC